MQTRAPMNTATVTTTATNVGPGLKRAIGHRDERRESALKTRICILEAALASILRETEVATRSPHVSFLAIHRIAAVARMAVGDDESS